MTQKDWVLLVVPILANGFVLYLLQLYFQSKLKRSERRNEIKQKINSEFFSLLLDIKSNFRTLGRCTISNPEGTVLFPQNLASFNQSIGKALEYYNDYSYFLNDYSSIVNQLESTFEEYSSVGIRLARSPLDDKGRKILEGYINHLYKISCQVADFYIKNI